MQLTLWTALIALAGGPFAASFQGHINWMKWHQNETFTMPSFFATLPLPTGDFAWAKMTTAAKSMLVLWAMITLFAAVIVWLAGVGDSLLPLHAALRERFGPGDAILLMTVLPLAAALGTAALAANVVWVALFGRGWKVVNAAWVTFVLVAFVVPPWLLRESARLAFLRDALPTMLGVLVALKVSVLGWLVWRVLSREHFDRARIFLILGCWTAAVGASFAMWKHFSPDVHAGKLLASLIIAMPALGIFGAPLALQMNRSR